MSGLLQTTHVALVDLQFTARQLRAELPPELEPADSGQGFLLTYTAEAPDADPPRSGAFLGVFLKGRDAPDGSPGIFVTQGFYSFDLAIARPYSTRFGPGEAAITLEDGLVTSVLSDDTGEVARFALRPQREQTVLNMGTHQYYGLRPGGLVTYSIAFSAPIQQGTLVDFETRPNARGLLRGLTRGAVLGASYAPGTPLVFSQPRQIAPHEPITSADSAHTAILEVLADVGRAAIVVDATGRLLFGNKQGHNHITTLLRDNRVLPERPDERRALVKLIDDAANLRHAGPGERLVLHRPDGRRLTVQAGTYRGGWQGVATALLLLYDHEAEAQRAPVEGLELLGLTPAEARIAAAIGQGLSARGASETLTLSENTVRSALKSIYAKLGIANRAQLGAIVTELRLPRKG